MQIKRHIKKITILLISFIFLISIVVLGINGDNSIAYSEPDTSSDAGVLDMCDNFRYIGLNKNKAKSYFYSYNNVSIGDFGSYSFGLTPISQFGNNVDAGNGEIVYKFSLDGNGVFLLLRSLTLSLEYEFLDHYNSSLVISYKTDDGSYNVLREINSENHGNIQTFNASFNDIIDSFSLDVQDLYVKISLNHETVKDIPLSDVSVRLYSVKFDGMQNFTMKKGARLKQSSYYSPDLSFRAYIAKDVYDRLIDVYASCDIILSNIIMPSDFIEQYDADLTRNNIDFRDGAVYVGNYKPGLKIVDSEISDYTLTVNGVTYYYYDGSVKLGNAYYTRDFISRAYIRILDEEKEVFFSFAAYKNDDLTENCRSTIYCAQKLIEKNSYLEDRLNSIYINKIKYEYLSSKYTVRKFYVDDDYNVVYESETVYLDDINKKIVLSDNDLKSDLDDYKPAKNGTIKNGDVVIYRNSEFDRVYPMGKTVIDLYFI